MTNQSSSDVESFSRQWTVSDTVLSIGFGLTGSATVMLGVLLPSLSQRWGLRDDLAGLLLFLQFLGSSMGAILTGANRIRALKIGYGLLVVSACALAFAGMWASFAIFFVFGTGLGMAMTSTSLLFSDRFGDDRAAKLERLNFAWSGGATAAPMLLTAFLRLAGFGPLFFLVQGLFLLVFFWVTFRERRETSFAQDEALPAQSPAPSGLLAPLVAMAMCAVGVESALSGWLTMYAHRAAPQSTGWSAFATSLFWFGIMLSRLVFSTRLLAIVGRRTVLRTALWGAAASVALLPAAHSPAAIQASAGLAGLCIGPVYPLVLSFLLERSPRGWIFAAAGVGSSLFPWLTGLLSADYGSLSYGLLAPCCAAVLMIVLQSLSFRQAGASTPAASSVPGRPGAMRWRNQSRNIPNPRRSNRG